MTYQEFLQILNRAYRNSPKLVKLVRQIVKSAETKTATFEMAQDYAIALGNILGETINDTGVLSDEELVYSTEYVANLLRPALLDSYELSSEAAMMVQDSINRSFGINLNAIKPKVDTNRIDNLITEVVNNGLNQNLDKLRQQFCNLNQSAVDSTITTNADFLEHSGISVRYTRIAESGSCKWCRSLSGTYNTHQAPDGFFGHHTNCHCIIKLTDMKPTGKVNYWTKRYDKAVQEGKINAALEQ